MRKEVELSELGPEPTAGVTCATEQGRGIWTSQSWRSVLPHCYCSHHAWGCLSTAQSHQIPFKSLRHSDGLGPTTDSVKNP